jgi:hypothetical protein
MEDDEDIIIPAKSLKDILDLTGRTLVGKVARRFEILDDIKPIKLSTKELIYEEFRALANLLYKFRDGRNVRIFKITPKSEE